MLKQSFALQYIEGIKKRGARIIILTTLEYSARAVICEAYKQVNPIREHPKSSMSDKKQNKLRFCLRPPYSPPLKRNIQNVEQTSNNTASIRFVEMSDREQENNEISVTLPLASLFVNLFHF